MAGSFMGYLFFVSWLIVSIFIDGMLKKKVRWHWIPRVIVALAAGYAAMFVIVTGWLVGPTAMKRAGLAPAGTLTPTAYPTKAAAGFRMFADEPKIMPTATLTAERRAYIAEILFDGFYETVVGATEDGFTKEAMAKAAFYLDYQEEGRNWVMYLRDYQMTELEYLSTIHNLLLIGARYSCEIGGDDPEHSSIFLYFYDEDGYFSRLAITGGFDIESVSAGDAKVFETATYDNQCLHEICKNHASQVARKVYFTEDNYAEEPYYEERYWNDEPRDFEEN